MKILYIDTAVSGHHITYMSALIEGNNAESILILPEKVDSIACKQHMYNEEWTKYRTFSGFRKFISFVCGVVRMENPDVVHFLLGDDFYKFFGYGLDKFKNHKTVFTLHRFRNGFLNQLSAKIFCSKVIDVVVHSKYLLDEMLAKGIKNVTHIEYPQFNKIECNTDFAKEYFGLKKDIPVIGCIGGTRSNKGLDILLKALENVDVPFQLLIAGKPVDFDENFVLENSKSFSDKLSLHLKFLTDEELSYALNASDIIALPYRKSFNGASGPLGEGIASNKCIVGPNHGTLGYTIETNHLGYTFESENVDALVNVIRKALEGKFVRDELYENYKGSLNVESFVEKYIKIYNNL